MATASGTVVAQGGAAPTSASASGTVNALAPASNLFRRVNGTFTQPVNVFHRMAGQWVNIDTGAIAGGGPGRRPMTLLDVRSARGVNWYGMDDALRGPTLAELQSFRAQGFTFIRLPISPTTTVATVGPVLANAVTAGIWVGVTRFTQGGKIGGVLITTANQQQWWDQAVADATAFGGWTSHVPLDINEPSQTGPVWEPISQGRVAAIRASGYVGIIGVCSGAASPAAGLNNATTGHPGGWWITDPNSFLEVHHYLGGLSDANLQSRATMDAYAAASGQGVTTYLAYVNKTWGFGAFGSATWTNVPILIGEFAMPPGMEAELDAFMVKVDARGVGACEWAMWDANPVSVYPWRISAAQRAILSAHTAGQIIVPITAAGVFGTATFDTAIYG